MISLEHDGIQVTSKLQDSSTISPPTTSVDAHKLFDTHGGDMRVTFNATTFAGCCKSYILAFYIRCGAS